MKSVRQVPLITYKHRVLGNWWVRFSSTSKNTIMLLAQSTLAPENSFVWFFTDQDKAVSFVDFLQHHDYWSPYVD